MPFGDRTGPLGRGPRTGRGAGYCSGYPVPGFLNPTPGFGFWGRGRGWRHMFWATGLPGWARFVYPPAPGYCFFPAQPTSDDEKEILKEQAENLKQALAEIEKRLQELEKEEK